MLTATRHFTTSGVARPTQGSLSTAWGAALAFMVFVAVLSSIAIARGLLMFSANRGPMLLIVGVLLLAYSTLAMAQQAPPNYGPDWSIIATAAVGMLALLVGAYAKGLAGRVGRTEEAITKVHNLLLGEYHNKLDIERTINQSATLLRTEMASISAMQGQMYGELQRIRGPHA